METKERKRKKKIGERERVNNLNQVKPEYNFYVYVLIFPLNNFKAILLLIVLFSYFLKCF